LLHGGNGRFERSVFARDEGFAGDVHGVLDQLKGGGMVTWFIGKDQPSEHESNGISH